MIRAVVGVLTREDKLLIAERPPGKSYAGYWEFPGGKIEANELSEAALKRELNEELGIEVIASNFWFDYSFTYPDKTVQLEMWKVTDFLGEPAGIEQQTLRWVTLQDMLELKLLAGMWPIVDKLKELSR